MKASTAFTLLLLTACGSQLPDTKPGQICKIVTFASSNVYDRTAELTIDGNKRWGIFFYLTRPPPDMSTGGVTQKICGKVPVRFRSGTLDVVATVDTSTDVNVVYIDPNHNPIIWSTNHPAPLLD